ncbi:MAG TPA: hypothetical protein VD929_03470 [Caulobacteraceae bacterium]|nr:hypothetical protein [Caulobacteraceae bacterium]
MALAAVLVALTLGQAEADPAPARPAPPPVFGQDHLLAGWRPAELSDYLDTPDYDRRRASPAADLKAQADFDGDGRPDEAGLYVNPTLSEYAVVVSFATRAGPVRAFAAKGPLYELGRIALRPAAAGRYAPVCLSASCGGEVVLKRAGLALFTYDAAELTVWWDGAGFRGAWTRL